MIECQRIHLELERSIVESRGSKILRFLHVRKDFKAASESYLITSHFIYFLVGRWGFQNNVSNGVGNEIFHCHSPAKNRPGFGWALNFRSWLATQKMHQK
jgi:hypothetical protein